MADSLGRVARDAAKLGVTLGIEPVNRYETYLVNTAAIGYDGDLVMESFVALNPDMVRATRMWRDVIGDPERLVVDGLAFLRDGARRHGLLPPR